MLLKDIAIYLHDQELGVFDEIGTNGNIFIAYLPENPPDCISLYDTGGPQHQVGTKLMDVRRTIQVLVRGSQYEEAHNRSWSIYKLLRDYVEFNGRKAIFRPNNPPIPIGQDGNGRHEYSINIFLWTKQD